MLVGKRMSKDPVTVTAEDLLIQARLKMQRGGFRRLPVVSDGQLGGIITAAQDNGELEASIPAHVAARMIFGILDELALAWVLTKQPLGGGAAGARPKKFDIVRAADWVITLVTRGLEKESQ